MIRILLQLGVAFVILFWGIASTGRSAEDASEVQWGKEVEGCRFRVEPARPSLPAGQAMRLKMTLENVGDKSIDVPYSSQLKDMYRFEVLLPDGEPAPLTRYGTKEFGENRGTVIISRSGRDLEAGKSVSESWPALNRIYDMTERGVYEIKVYRRVFPPREGAMLVDVPSNSFKIKLFEGPDVPDESQEKPKEE